MRQVTLLILGPPDSRVKMVVEQCFECPSCGREAHTAEAQQRSQPLPRPERKEQSLVVPKRSLVEGQRQRTAAARHDQTRLVLPAAAVAAGTCAAHAPALAGKLQLARKTGIFCIEHVALRSIPREALADKLRVLSLQHCHVSQLVHLCVDALGRKCVGC